MAITCPQCNTENSDESSFCANCGTSLASASESEASAGPYRPGIGPTSGELPVLASRLSRLGSFILDALIAAVPAFIFLAIAVELYVVWIIAILAIQAYFLTVDGQSLGKKIVGLKIVKVGTDENGGFVTNVLVRTIFNGILNIIPFYGLVDALFIFRGDRRTIHDLIAGTEVVRA